MYRSERSASKTRALDTAEGAPLLRFSLVAEGALLAGRYRVLGSLGSGGCGQVYRVEDTLAGGQVALKVLFPQASREARESAAFERLRRELRLLRELRHPGIVGVRDIGEHEGLLLLVMELLEGETLGERLRRRGRLAPDEAARVLEGILAALEAAHARGIVHRDVKPSNVFLARDAASEEESDERVVLLDFGLARRGDEERVTETGQLVGTLEYVSPEQARGESPLGPASDLYAAGVVAWEMLSGQTPFAADSAARVLAGHLSEPLPHPPRALADAPAWLRDLVVWCLEKEPSRRPASAGLLLARLKARRRRGPLARLAAWARARGRPARIALVAAPLVALALAAALVPTRLELREGALVRTSALGRELGTLALPRAVNHFVETGGHWPWERRFVGSLAAQGRRPLPQDYASGLFEVTPWARAASHVDVAAAGWQHGAAHLFPRYDRVMESRALHASPWLDEQGQRLVLYVVQNASGAPTTVLLLDGEGRSSLHVEHLGGLDSPAPFVQTDEGQRLVLLAGNNMALGDRAMYAAFATSGSRSMTNNLVATPPYEEPGTARGRPLYYVFLSATGAAELKEVERVALARTAGGGSVRFDPPSGVPLDEEARGGLSRENWLERQRVLHGLLERASRNVGRASTASAALAFERFAKGPGDRAQRGVALGEAARLWQAAGESGRALALIEEAMALEPDFAGHRRRHVDLLIRREGWRAAAESLGRESVMAVADPRLMRDIALGALLTGERGEAQAYIESMSRAPGAYVHFSIVGCLLLALHDAAPEGLPSCRAIDPNDFGRLPFFSFIEAATLATADPPRPHEALAILDRHERGWGFGSVVPVVPLRAHLARLGAGEPPPRAEVERAMREQERAARTNLLSWFMLEIAGRFELASPANEASAGADSAERSGAALS